MMPELALAIRRARWCPPPVIAALPPVVPKREPLRSVRQWRPPQRAPIVNLYLVPIILDPFGPWAKPLSSIMRQVCVKHGFSIDEMMSARRAILLCDARKEFYYRAYTETSKSLPAIGRFITKDHTTVLHGIRAYCRRNNLPLPNGMAWGRRFAA